MKYWNKDKKIRQEHWHKVPATFKTDYFALKVWCQRQESKGKFYAYAGGGSWWFENEQDALHFTMKWC